MSVSTRAIEPSTRATMTSSACLAASTLLVAPVSERRILLGSVAYSICFAATFTVTGFLVGDAVRAA